MLASAAGQRTWYSLVWGPSTYWLAIQCRHALQGVNPAKQTLGRELFSPSVEHQF